MRRTIVEVYVMLDCVMDWLVDVVDGDSCVMGLYGCPL